MQQAHAGETAHSSDEAVASGPRRHRRGSSGASFPLLRRRCTALRLAADAVSRSCSCLLLRTSPSPMRISFHALNAPTNDRNRRNKPTTKMPAHVHPSTTIRPPCATASVSALSRVQHWSARCLLHVPALGSSHCAAASSCVRVAADPAAASVRPVRPLCC